MSMYNDYFGLTENPFSIAPDPRYMYLSDQHREALAHLLYGIESEGGFVMLTGEVGTGKTTICRCLLEQIPENCNVAFIFNPKLTVEELLSTICDEFRIEYPAGTTSIKVFVDLLNTYLLDSHANNRKAVIIIDEAQNLNSDVLEQIRLLTNLETNQRKLLQIILLGQPELRDKLTRPELRQLSQRIIARHHLGPLDSHEVTAYVNHRLTVAGSRRPIFPTATLSQLYRLSGGIPRLINVLCDRALLGCYVEGKEKVDKSTLKKAAREVFGDAKEKKGAYRQVALWPLVAVLSVTGAALFGAAYYQLGPQTAKTGKVAADGTKTNLAAPSGSAVKKAIPVEEPLKPVHLEDQNAVGPGAKALQITRSDISAKQSAPKASNESDPPERVLKSPPASSDNAIQAHGETLAAEQKGKAVNQVQSPSPTAKLIWSADKPNLESESFAYKDLFGKWGANYTAESSTSPCNQAEAQGLQCLSGKGGLDDLRKFNRPAILKLYDGQGRKFYATLTALNGKGAEFLVASKQLVVSVDEVALRWMGDYTLLWQVPPGYQGLIKIGDRGPAVQWLQQQLSKLQGKNKWDKTDAIFDQTMENEIKKFQLSSGLKPDGMIGPQTLILLNTAVNSPSPLLFRDQKDD